MSVQYTYGGRRNHTSGDPLMDHGPNPFVIDMNKATIHNENYRTALWTGKYSQLTLMSIPVGQDVGLEVHVDHDQILRVESGQGLAKMGPSEDNLNFSQPVYVDSVIFVPAGSWHNIINTGTTPLKLNTIYAPVEHEFGTVHPTKEDAEKEEY